MHDPMTVAFEVRSPVKRGKAPHTYRPTVLTVWHVDPEKDGTDDSCGWFMRARHGDAEQREAVRRAFEFEWTHGCPGWFNSNGDPNYSTIGTVVQMFRVATGTMWGHQSRRQRRFMEKHLLDILYFAENTGDSLYTSINQHYGRAGSVTERVESTADCVYSWIARTERPWYRHPRWHVWHWKLRIHALQDFKRWAFSRCAKCGKRFTWGYCPSSNSWHGTGPRWFRGEADVFHSECHAGRDGAGPSTPAPEGES